MSPKNTKLFNKNVIDSNVENKIEKDWKCKLILPQEYPNLCLLNRTGGKASILKKYLRHVCFRRLLVIHSKIKISNFREMFSHVLQIFRAISSVCFEMPHTFIDPSILTFFTFFVYILRLFFSLCIFSVLLWLQLAFVLKIAFSLVPCSHLMQKNPLGLVY